jgi:hypothetical protein
VTYQEKSGQAVAVRPGRELAAPEGVREDIATYAKWVVESGLFGQGITQAQAGLKMLIGQEIGIKPLVAVQNIYLFQAKGRPVVIFDGNLLLGLVKASGRYDYKILQHDRKGTVIEAVEKDPMTGRWASMGPPVSFTDEDVPKALASKEGPWSEGFGRDMKFWRAVSRLVDHYMPHLLLGLSAEVVTVETADAMEMTDEDRKAVFATMKEAGLEMDHDERCRWATDVLGRQVDSFARGEPTCPTHLEAGVLIQAAKALAPQDVAEVVEDAVVVEDVVGDVAAAEPSSGVTAGDSPAAAPEPDDAEELADLQRKAVEEYRVLSARLPSEWRPWFRNNVEDIEAGAWEKWPRSFNVAQLLELFERLEKVRPWGDPEPATQ